MVLTSLTSSGSFMLSDENSRGISEYRIMLCSFNSDSWCRWKMARLNSGNWMDLDSHKKINQNHGDRPIEFRVWILHASKVLQIAVVTDSKLNRSSTSKPATNHCKKIVLQIQTNAFSLLLSLFATFVVRSLIDVCVRPMKAKQTNTRSSEILFSLFLFRWTRTVCCRWYVRTGNDMIYWFASVLTVVCACVARFAAVLLSILFAALTMHQQNLKKQTENIFWLIVISLNEKKKKKKKTNSLTNLSAFQQLFQLTWWNQGIIHSSSAHTKILALYGVQLRGMHKRKRSTWLSEMTRREPRKRRLICLNRWNGMLSVMRRRTQCLSMRSCVWPAIQSMLASRTHTRHTSDRHSRIAPGTKRLIYSTRIERKFHKLFICLNNNKNFTSHRIFQHKLSQQKIVLVNCASNVRFAVL